jgi:hypothetical protein
LISTLHLDFQSEEVLIPSIFFHSHSV